MLKEDLIKIAQMRPGGKILGEIMALAVSFAKEGVSTLQIEYFVREKMQELGVKPSFTKVRDYKYYTCISVNDGVVHGIPTEYKLRHGDRVGIDIGVFFRGFNTDMSWSVLVEDETNPELLATKKFLLAGQEALTKAIEQAKAGNRIGNISSTIQAVIENAGYSVVRQLVGHAVGKKLHEYPQIPGILTRPIEKTEELKPGMTLAIEIIYAKGKPEIVYKNDDGWSIATKDGSLSGLFEATVAILDEDNEILTPFNRLLKQAN